MPSIDILSQLAGHALSERVGAEAIGPLAVEQLGYSLLDLFGCYLAARHMGANSGIEQLARECDGPAEASLWGSTERVAAAQAALAAGTIAHHVEFDGGWHGPPGVGIHPAVTVLPAAIAMAEHTGASGRGFIAAASAGYDVLAVMARWLCPGITAFKLHPPGMLGSFGAAAAAGRLLRHDPQHLAGALAYCGGISPLCPFESFTAGASAKNLYGGWPAAIGVVAAQQPLPAALSFTLPRMLGRADAEMDVLLGHLRTPALLGADFKAYPTCRSVHPALTALEDLLTATPVGSDEVDRIAVETYPYAVDLDSSADPAWPIGARTSIGACLALRLRHGPLGPEHFSLESLADHDVRRLEAATRVSVGSFAERPVRGAAVKLFLRDGRILERDVDAERWGGRQPATREELLQKFRRLAGASLKPADMEELIERTLGIDKLASMRLLTGILARAAFPLRDPRRLRGVASPSSTGLGARLDAVESRMGAMLESRGASSAPLHAMLAATRLAAQCQELAAAERDRALSLALALAPCGAGPVPDAWPARQGELMARLAARGHGGPPGVIDGARGLRHLLL